MRAPCVRSRGSRSAFAPAPARTISYGPAPRSWMCRCSSAALGSASASSIHCEPNLNRRARRTPSTAGVEDSPRVEKRLVGTRGAVEVLDEEDQPGDPGDAQLVLGRRPGRDAKVAGGDIFDHERQRRAGAARPRLRQAMRCPSGRKRPPSWGPSSSIPACVRRSPSKSTLSERSAKSTVPSPFANRRPPLVILGAVRLPEGDQLEIGAVGERDQRVVGRAAGVLATRGDGESEPRVVIRGGHEIADRDDDVIDALHVVLLRHCQALLPLSHTECAPRNAPNPAHYAFRARVRNLAFLPAPAYTLPTAIARGSCPPCRPPMRPSAWPASRPIFYIVTGVWPIVSMRSFEAITGPKVDRWLVKTVGALVAVIGCALALASRRRQLAPGDRARRGRQRGGPGHDRHRLRRQAPHLAGLPAGRGR